MNSYAEKTKENTGQSVANTFSQKKSGNDSAFQFEDNRPEAIAQRKLQDAINNRPQVNQLSAYQGMIDNYSAQQKPIQKNENQTGLPDNLKSSLENLSGYSMDDVKVHYNSDKPAQLQAQAYAQGTGIYLASGQEKHLPHEAWHVVQQKQGRVKPTMQMKGKVNINDDRSLEKEADVMGRQTFDFLTIHNETTKQLKLNNAQIGNGIKQLISIESAAQIQYPQLLVLIKEALPELDKRLMGNLAKKLFKDVNHFNTRQEAIAYITTEGTQYQKAVAGAGAVKDKGDAIEAAAAVIIGGQVNRGENGRDVEWRMIDREMAEGIKKLVEIPQGHDSDQELFENWGTVRRTLENKFNGKDLSEIISTPTDAFSSKIIAIAGGPAKFLEGTTGLKEKDGNRVKELIKLANLLEYTPVLVFSVTVTCEQCEAVASEFGINVIHLES